MIFDVHFEDGQTVMNLWRYHRAAMAVFSSANNSYRLGSPRRTQMLVRVVDNHPVLRFDVEPCSSGDSSDTARRLTRLRPVGPYQMRGYVQFNGQRADYILDHEGY